MSKYKHDFLSICNWVNEHKSFYWIHDEIVHGLRRYSLNRDKVLEYIGYLNADDMLIFEKIWSMYLQVNPRTIEKAYPPPPHAIIYR